MARPPSKSNLSMFIGLWLGLTVAAGGGVFALLYWAMSNSNSGATPQPPPAASVCTS